MLLSYIAAYVLVLVALVGATPTPYNARWSSNNAARLARGLPPLKPRFSRTLPGVVQRAPTRVQARSASPSPSISARKLNKRYEGTIMVRSADDTDTFGYVTASNTGLVVGDRPDDALRVSVHGGPYYDVQIDNPGQAMPSCVGAAVTKTAKGAALDKDSISAVPMSAVSPSAVGANNGDQSRVWEFHTTLGYLSPNFVNPDGTVSSTHLGYDPKNNQLLFIGDMDAYNSAHPDAPLEAVRLWLE